MDQLLENCEGVASITDDVAVTGKTEEEHDRNIIQLMETAKKSGLVFNSTKCHIKQTQISFYGMIFGADGVHPDPRKVTDICNMPEPTTKKEIQEFLGLIQYLAPFIPKLSEESSLLRDLLKKDVPFTWDADQRHCFSTLKTLISSDATLQYYDVDSPATLQVDASLRGLGAALLQPDKNGRDRPIAYASKSLSDTETRYANIERELLAVCFGVERFKTYLYGRQFTVITDHKPLVMILDKGMICSPSRLQRMILRLQGYDFKIVYRPGKEMTLPDSLSRLPNPNNVTPIDLDLRVDFVQFTPSKLAEIQKETRHEPILCDLMEKIIQGWPDTIRQLPKPMKPFWSFRDELSIENGLILKGKRLFIPESCRESILERLHTGHLGIQKTQLRAKGSVYWPGITKDIEHLCARCPTCQKFQATQQHETLMQQEIPTRPWDIVGTDLFTFDKSQYLIVSDYYSKFIMVRKLPDPAPSIIVVSMMKQIFAEHGIPSKVMSDNGPHYASVYFKQFANEWSFEHVTSSPHYPRSNGFIERQVQTVKNVMKKCKDANEDVEMGLLTLRTTPIDAKLPSPAEMLFQRRYDPIYRSASKTHPVSKMIFLIDYTNGKRFRNTSMIEKLRI